MEVRSKTTALNNSDESLIQQAKDGDMEAFHKLYERFLPIVYRRVRYLVPADELEDVIQEIFIAAFRSLPSYRGDGHFGAWLRILTKRGIAAFYRKRSLRQNPPLEPLFENSGPNEEDGPQQLEERIQIRLALRELPEKYREIILQRFVEDLEFHEIAEVEGHSLEAVRSLYRRALHALTEIYKKKT